MLPSEKLRLYDRGVDINESYESYAEALTLRQGDIVIPAVRMSEPLRNEALHFLECIREGRTPVSDGINGLQVLKILHAAQRSLEQGGTPIALEPYRPVQLSVSAP
jgi:predicted dehydrogenase